MDKAAEGKERQGWMESWRVVVVVVMVEGGERETSSSSLHKPVHSKDGPFNLH